MKDELTKSEENNGLVIHSMPNIFLSKRTTFVRQEGKTIAEILKDVDMPTYANVYVVLDGEHINEEDFNKIIPKNNSVITIKAVPTGGGKNIFRTILSIVVIVAAMWVAPQVAGLFAEGSFLGMAAGAVASMATMTVGMLLVNAIAPMSVAGNTSSSGSLGNGYSGGYSAGGSGSSSSSKPNYALSSANNALTPYGVIPMLLGRHRVTPPYGARPFTTFIGNDQYLYALFCIGYGIVRYSDHRLGETSISNYNDLDIELKYGDDSTNTTLFTRDVYQEDLSIVLKQVDGWQTRETREDIMGFSVDVSYPYGLVKLEEDGNTTQLTSLLDIRYRKVNGDGTFGNWSGVLHNEITYA